MSEQGLTSTPTEYRLSGTQLTYTVLVETLNPAHSADVQTVTDSVVITREDKFMAVKRIDDCCVSLSVSVCGERVVSWLG